MRDAEGLSAFFGEVGMRVLLVRTKRRLSQDRLAELAKLSRVTLGSVERGELDARISTYRSLALALDVPLSLLFSEGDVLRELGNLTGRLRLVRESERT